jgi:hypothetical protein
MLRFIPAALSFLCTSPWLLRGGGLCECTVGTRVGVTVGMGRGRFYGSSEAPNPGPAAACGRRAAGGRGRAAQPARALLHAFPARPSADLALPLQPVPAARWHRLQSTPHPRSAPSRASAHSRAAPQHGPPALSPLPCQRAQPRRAPAGAVASALQCSRVRESARFQRGGAAVTPRPPCRRAPAAPRTPSTAAPGTCRSRTRAPCRPCHTGQTEPLTLVRAC